MTYELSKHAHDLATALGVALYSDLDDESYAQANVLSGQWRVDTVPVTDVRTYYIALHELGHVANPPAGTVSEFPDELRAWLWAVESALVMPDNETRVFMACKLAGYRSLRSEFHWRGQPEVNDLYDALVASLR